MYIHADDYWSGSEGIFWVDGGVSSTWNILSLYITKTTDEHPNVRVRLDNDNERQDVASYYDGFLCINLTETFGAGNEPTKEWCDKNISYFDGTTKIYK